ncbi:VCBS repeat-containing protein [Mucilaginibacter gilvus]|uniref:RNA-binding protein n=1 Tax=Mucilaginibacter gilvus TaxID=2305909 RepID=A0A3S3WDD4_9SPHI|nr:VCBS repeat-containing protein [Mucilaginibacter gilvus]RWY54284.1 RNA-binding protein [Mucilaginibacter gilvus]
MRAIIFLIASAFLLFCASCKKATLFEQVPGSQSNIHFNNLITENDSINPIDNAYIYNGGGVGVGDFNNDGLQDIYFTGNMVSNRLYLNQGNFVFKDITAAAGVTGDGRWGRGATIVDINNDGFADIYVSNSLLTDSLKRQNFLYVNQGLDKDGMPHFKDMAHEYGLDLKMHSTMAAFFDYDNDGDLDMYQAVNWPNNASYANIFRPIFRDGTYPSTGRLYRNDWNAKLRHPVFRDVSKQARIGIEGYSHGVSIADINRDGWKDIYVTNDFLSNNILYINNRDGTFTDKSKEYFKHTSFNAMGQDIVDMNNDGLADIFELDMNPEGNYRKKMMSMANSYQTFQNFDHYGYQYQYVRNTLQLNQGPRVGQNDSVGAPIFSEVSFMSGVAQTDWSWAPLITDFDNDGYRDIIVTNGYPRDVTDHDFITFRNNPYLTATKNQILEQIPQVKIHNYAFKNTGGIKFNDESESWGFAAPTFSSGAAYADLDNDGDMDVIINNIDDEASVYKNNSRQNTGSSNHYINIAFVGPKQNINGIGSWIDIYYNKGRHQVYENSPYRGYLSSIQNMVHFGITSATVIDSVVVKWPNGKKQILKNVKVDQLLTLKTLDAKMPYNWQQPGSTKSLFTEVTKAAGVNFIHKESEYVDFNIQKLLPHKLSAYTPALSSADINGDSLDDIVIGGNDGSPAQVFLQQRKGKFVQRNLLAAGVMPKNEYKDGGILLFDANNDGKQDIYITGSGYEKKHNTPYYQDRLYLNDGLGNFTLAPNALPINYSSKLCVRAIDYDKDGKPDLFVSGRVDPWNYPKAVSSVIYHNDSENGIAKFTDVTGKVAPDLANAGMICDALFTDFDNDGWVDLMLAGEWAPIKFLKNKQGVFSDVSVTTGLNSKTGWWNSIVAGDFRHTGRMDYIVSNTGLNTLYQVSDTYPGYITAKDFDKRDRFDAFPSFFLKGEDGVKREYPVNVRDDAIKQMITLRQRFTNYRSFANATISDMFTTEQLKGALRLNANEQRSCLIRNDGNGKFTMIPLPAEAQTAPLNGMIADDFDGDGNTDLLATGNDFGTDMAIGRYDASNGLFLKGDGRGNFKVLSILQSGIFIPGDGKALIKLAVNNGIMIAGSQHKGALKLFKLNNGLKVIKLLPSDVTATLKLTNGAITRQEFHYGSSFLSQSSRICIIGGMVESLIVVNNKGVSRNIAL